MEISTIITLVLVLGIVWGGVVFFLVKAYKHEKLKEADGEE